MTESFDPCDDSVVWIADTGLFIACGRQQNNKYTALERFARRLKPTTTSMSMYCRRESSSTSKTCFPWISIEFPRSVCGAAVMRSFPSHRNVIVSVISPMPRGSSTYPNADGSLRFVWSQSVKTPSTKQLCEVLKIYVAGETHITKEIIQSE